ncbi:MAG TPA: peptidylprolyl isomerase [Cyclobacteriaceae bacterium]|jgi:cyclophilin family peptidyl-prolyl cis-trans isomerase|nr:peptidylprolyl isomerase [Cyclobacteriaceae bacterium]
MIRYSILTLFAFSLIVSAYAQKPSKKDFVITIKTNYGEMVVILSDETPKHKANFIKLAKEHYFDSLLFHRVIPEFMIQGGDPNSKKAKPGQSLGTGGPGYLIDAEFSPKLFHKKGALAAARTNNPEKASSGSQFYIVQGKVLTGSAAEELKVDQSKLRLALQQFLAKPERASLRDSLSKLYSTSTREAFNQKVFSLIPQIEKETGTKLTKDVSPEMIKAYSTIGGTPHLDGDYTVFGEVIKGLDVLDKIAAVKKDGSDRPLEDVRMFVSVEELSKKKITKLYGYQYPIVKK